eukprot:scaffold16134_cov32-Tisochrysis_lutea.AAC.1
MASRRRMRYCSGNVPVLAGCRLAIGVKQQAKRTASPALEQQRRKSIEQCSQPLLFTRGGSVSELPLERFKRRGG